MSIALPAGLHFFERGWLSSNAVFLDDGHSSVLIDTGYHTHSSLLLDFLHLHLNDRSLSFLVNTHLHSDHCGGNKAVQTKYPQVETLIPYGLFSAVLAWDTSQLSFDATGQACPSFKPDNALRPGDVCNWSGFVWEIHASPGHDHDALLFFNPQHRILISADALWAHGFGVIFPEIMGGQGFREVNETLNLIEHLDPLIVLPGHGSMFSNVQDVLKVAYERLDFFQQNPIKHATHSAKVLLKFRLLEMQRIPIKDFHHWAISAPLLVNIHKEYFENLSFNAWIDELINELCNKRSACLEAGLVINT